jgi:hypothetical protein
MKIAELVARGATVCGGGVDYQREYIGKLMADGEVLLSPRGEEVVAGFAPIKQAPPAPPKPVVPPAKPAPRVRMQVNDELKGLDDL